MTCNCGCQKVVFSGSSNATQAMGVNDTLSFTRNLSMGLDFTSDSVVIKRPGLYLVNVSASGAVTGAAAADIILQLQKNGQNLEGAYRSIANSTAATDIRNLSITGIVRVDPTQCCMDDKSATITVVNTGAAATYSSITITVVRI